MNTSITLAIEHREAGRFDQAISVLQAQLPAQGQNAAVHAHLAHLLMLTRQDDAALAALQQALSLDATLPVVQRNLARLQLRRQQVPGAVQAALAACQGEPGDPENMLVLAAALGAAGETAKASALIEAALALRPHYAEALLTRAQQRLRANDAAGALADALAAFAVKPHWAAAAALTATLRHRAGDLHGAIQALEAARAQDPAHVEYIVMLGEFKRQARQTEAAIALLEQAVALAPGHASAWTNLGAALQQAGRMAEARSAYEKALAANPAQAEVANNLGALALQEKDEASAITWFGRATAIRPDFARAHVNLGDAHERLGQAEQALAAFQQAIGHAPTLPDAWQHLGDVLASMDRTDEARQAYLKVLQLDPAGAGLGAAVWLAVGYYLDGDLARCRAMLQVAEPVTAMNDEKYTAYRNYWLYLVQLGLYAERHGLPPQTGPQPTPLYVIGESHCLAAHGVDVQHQGLALRCRARWIVGCKQWHLGSARPNKYQRRLAFILQGLAPGSDILLTIGEIDCRLDEGIFSAWKKSPGKSLEQMAHETAQAYVRHVAAAVAPLGHRVILSGVPAIRATLAEKEGTPEALVQMVREFNAMLRKLAGAAGMGFLDVHALTDRGDGLADGAWHIDNHHLQPHAIARAFELHSAAGDFYPGKNAV